MTFEIASLVSFDQINLTGTFDAGGVMSVTLNYGPAVGTTFDLMDFGSFVDSGYAFSFTNTDAAYWDTGAFATTGSITIIPEPGMMGVLALGMLSLAGRSRKPRR